jgi:hypothetical protein
MTIIKTSKFEQQKNTRKKSIAYGGTEPPDPCLGKIPTHATPMIILFS